MIGEIKGQVAAGKGGYAIVVSRFNEFITAKLLSGVKCPVVAPSANKSGEKAAVNAKEVIEQLSGKVDMVLDGGLCK